MIEGAHLQNMAVPSSRGALTDREREVVAVVTEYFSAAREVPSSGWVARRLNISRQRAYVYIERVRDKGWLSDR